jgi:hypothetical protein
VSRPSRRRARSLAHPVERDSAYIGLVLSGWIPSSTTTFDKPFEAEPARTITDEDSSELEHETS